MEQGRVMFEGGIDEAVDVYLTDQEIIKNKYLKDIGCFDISSHDNKKQKGIGIIGVEIFCDERRTNTLLTGAKVEFKFIYRLNEKFKEPVLGVVIKDLDDLEIIGLNNRNTGDSLITKDKTGEIIMSFPVFRIIKSKCYKVDLYFGDEENNIDTIYDAFNFNVLPPVLNDKKPIQEKFNIIYDSEIRFK